MFRFLSATAKLALFCRIGSRGSHAPSLGLADAHMSEDEKAYKISAELPGIDLEVAPARHFLDPRIRLGVAVTVRVRRTKPTTIESGAQTLYRAEVAPRRLPKRHRLGCRPDDHRRLGLGAGLSQYASGRARFLPRRSARAS